MNQISLIGRPAADSRNPRRGNHEVATFRLAVRRRSANHDAGAVFIEVKTFDGLAETVADYLGKGRKVAVSGRLEQGEWTTKEGEYRSKHQVIADQVEFLDAPETADDQSADPEPAPQAQARRRYRRAGPFSGQLLGGGKAGVAGFELGSAGGVERVDPARPGRRRPPAEPVRVD
jgi:single-strand DNA-binding protein